MADVIRTQRVLVDLHHQGLRVALDDLGTGYSSPARLKGLPVEGSKIDPALVGAIPGDAAAGGIVQAVVHLARSLQIEPVPEGVETAEQRRFLLEAGCARGQGFLFGPPLTGTAMGRLLKHSSRSSDG